MANIYDAHQRVKQELKTVSTPQSRNGNKVKGKLDKKISDDEFMAAALGDTEWLRQSLRGQKGVIHFDSNGLAPIHLAAIHGRLDSLKLLVEKLKVDVNLASSTGWRPIHLVISSQTGKRSFNCLQYLLQKGADHSVCNDDGITPVHQAASEGHVQCLKVLIDAGAVIDELDVRNHKPIDLAKLWGHRKCARILATESWHREKDDVAKQMKQLEKLKMQNILQEIEQEEQLLAHQQFYSNIAFSEWLDTKGLPAGQQQKNSDSNKLKKGGQKGPKISGPNSKKTPKKGVRNDSETPESKRKTMSSKAITEEEESARTTPKSGGMIRKPMNTYPRSDSKESSSVTPEEEEMEFEQTGENKETELEEEAANKHPPQWNTSTHLPLKEYITNLTDYYPRDEYTMMPKYPLKKGDPVKMLTPKPDKHTLKSASSRRPNLPDDVIKKALSPSKERPVLYKPVAIMDVHKRKYYREGERPSMSEAGMHLSNDVSSPLFQTGLVHSNQSGTSHSDSSSSFSTSTSTSKQSSSSGLGSVDLLNVDIPAVMKLMKKISPPTRYPAITGDEYIISTKQAVGI